MPSPTRFHNSVHNGPIGLRVHRHRQPRLLHRPRRRPRDPGRRAAGGGGPAGRARGDVVVVLADEPPAPPFARSGPYPPLAVALHLSAAAGPGHAGPSLRDLRRAPAGAPRLPGAVRRPPLRRRAWRWRRRSGRGAAGEVALGPDGERGWAVDVAAGVGAVSAFPRSAELRAAPAAHDPARRAAGVDGRAGPAARSGSARTRRSWRTAGCARWWPSSTWPRRPPPAPGWTPAPARARGPAPGSCSGRASWRSRSSHFAGRRRARGGGGAPARRTSGWPSFRCRVRRGEELVAAAVLSVYQRDAGRSSPP